MPPTLIARADEVIEYFGAAACVHVVALTHYHFDTGMSRLFVELEKRSLPRLMLSGDGLASKDAV